MSECPGGLVSPALVKSAMLSLSCEALSTLRSPHLPRQTQDARRISCWLPVADVGGSCVESAHSVSAVWPPARLVHAANDCSGSCASGDMTDSGLSLQWHPGVSSKLLMLDAGVPVSTVVGKCGNSVEPSCHSDSDSDSDSEASSGNSDSSSSGLVSDGDSVEREFSVDAGVDDDDDDGRSSSSLLHHQQQQQCRQLQDEEAHASLDSAGAMTSSLSSAVSPVPDRVNDLNDHRLCEDDDLDSRRLCQVNDPDDHQLCEVSDLVELGSVEVTDLDAGSACSASAVPADRLDASSTECQNHLHGDHVEHCDDVVSRAEKAPLSPGNGANSQGGLAIENLKNSYLRCSAQKSESSVGKRHTDLKAISVDMRSLKHLYSNGDASQSTPPSPRPAPLLLLPAGAASISSVRQAYEQQSAAAADDQSRASFDDLSQCGVGAGCRLNAASLNTNNSLTNNNNQNNHLFHHDNISAPISLLRSKSHVGSPGSEQARIHVRSYSSSKAIKKFNASAGGEERVDCRCCGRQVFQMERVRAEGAAWHKNCFRCHQCNRLLSVDTYASHEGQLYCIPHHKLLLLPKAVENNDEEDVKAMLRRKREVIIRESEPVQLPDDVVRSSSKADYGLDDLQNLNVRDRFSVFEHAVDVDDPGHGTNNGTAQNGVKTSTPVGSIMKKMKKFQQRANELDSHQRQMSESDLIYSCSEDESGDEDADNSACSGDDAEHTGTNGDTEGDEPRKQRGSAKKSGKIKSPKVVRERPVSFSGMDEVKSRFEEHRGISRREQLREERKGELSRLRDMICGAREHRTAYEEALKEQDGQKYRKDLDDIPQINQSDLKASYVRALADASGAEHGGGGGGGGVDLSAEIGSRITATLASKFESGAIGGQHAEHSGRLHDDDTGLLQEADTARDARSLFKQLDTAEPQQTSLLHAGGGAPGVLRSSSSVSARAAIFAQEANGDANGCHDDAVDDELKQELTQCHTTSNMLQKFKQLELGTSEGTAGAGESPSREKASGNARQVLSLFKQLEQRAIDGDCTDHGPKPLKSFTPPPDYTGVSSASGSDDDYTYTDNDDDDDDEHIANNQERQGSPHHPLDSGRSSEKARNLTAKFERWQEKSNLCDGGLLTVEDECRPSLDTTKNLKAMFESLKDRPATNSADKTSQKVSRFIMETGTAEMCGICGQRVYAMERLVVDKRVMHKNCFRCHKCNCVLRMDKYSTVAGVLYCTPHFTQLFKTKGNYEEGFGVECSAKTWRRRQGVEAVSDDVKGDNDYNEDEFAVVGEPRGNSEQTGRFDSKEADINGHDCSEQDIDLDVEHPRVVVSREKNGLTAGEFPASVGSLSDVGNNGGDISPASSETSSYSGSYRCRVVSKKVVSGDDTFVDDVDDRADVSHDGAFDRSLSTLSGQPLTTEDANLFDGVYDQVTSDA